MVCRTIETWFLTKQIFRTTNDIFSFSNKIYSNKRMATNNKGNIFTPLKFFYTSSYSLRRQRRQIAAIVCIVAAEMDRIHPKCQWMHTVTCRFFWNKQIIIFNISHCFITRTFLEVDWIIHNTDILILTHASGHEFRIYKWIY